MITISAGAKINLGLRIRGIRTDGYHEIDSIFYPVKFPADKLLIEPQTECRINIICDSPYIEPQQNLLLKTWERFWKATRFFQPQTGVQIRLDKKIPIGAGMGGGSSDAANFLLWLNKFCGNILSEQELQNVATSIGADVPFFLINKVCRVQGIGDIVTPIPFSGDGWYMLMVYPNIYINTTWAFRAYDELMGLSSKKQQNHLTKAYERAKESLDFTSEDNILKLSFRNDLEIPVFKRYPKLGLIKKQLLDLGAAKCCMSGSGSTLSGIFNCQKTAQKAVKILHSQNLTVFFTPL